ncbi:MAG: flagellar hook-basal body protein [Phycisphaerae bacterium]|nr:flagellar hook-basal body protein [Phycisphaerae bacterium]
MIYGIWHSAAGMQVQEYRQAVIANNLANVDTPAYKPDVVAIVERPVASATGAIPGARHPILDRLTGGLFETPTRTDFSAGAIEPTHNALDLAIIEDGFFRVETVDGPRLTRDGRLTVRDDGTLVTVAAGLPILDRAGQSIRVNARDASAVRIDDAGTVRQGAAVLGRLDLVGVADPQQLTKVGRNLFDSGTQRLDPAGGVIRSNAVEQSAASPVTSLVQMIAASRAYELNATMISMQDATLQRVVNDLGRLG